MEAVHRTSSSLASAFAVLVTSTVAVLALAACGSSRPGPDRTSTTSPTTSRPTSRPTTRPAGGTSPVAPRTQTGVGQFPMPDLRDVDLERARSILAAQGPMTVVVQDSTGRGRQVTPPESRWRVCAQVPAAGAQTSTDQLALLRVAPIGERCVPLPDNPTSVTPPPRD